MGRHKALDTAAIWSRLQSVHAVGQRRVRFTLKTVDYPALAVLAHQMIVPEHIWASIKKPVEFTNPVPVASGPYTEVKTFRTQLFELGLNPHYWQATEQLAKKLRMPAYSGNDTVSLGLVSGEIDWAGHALPLIERTYVARDPVHFKYWFPPYGGMVFLYANTARAPFHKAKVRKAISHAIDRKRLVRVGMSGYTKPADGSGLSPTYQTWKCCQADADAVTAHDPAAAIALLKASGCQRDDSTWSCQGKPLQLTLEVVNGWSDWIRTAQLIKQDLAEIGIHIEVKTLDFGAWFDHVQKGQFDLSIGWSNEGHTPYDFYRQLVSTKTRKPEGEASPSNWHRYGDAQFDRLLDTFSQTPEGPKRKTIIHELQSRFIEILPAIPLFPNPSWGTYSTRYFEGFPSGDNPYGKLSPHADPERLLVLTRVRAKRSGR
jgi:peptide/nickel transport system substrate-binding protein